MSRVEPGQIVRRQFGRGVDQFEIEQRLIRQLVHHGQRSRHSPEQLDDARRRALDDQQ